MEIILNIWAVLIISVFVIFALIVAGLKAISAIMSLLIIMALVWAVFRLAGWYLS